LSRALFTHAEREHGEPASQEALTGLSVGFLAMLPLFAVYELGLAGGELGRRNVGERLMTLAFEPLGERVVLVRIAALAAGALAALWVLRTRKVAVGAALARVLLEGIAVAILIGPALVAVLALTEDWLPRLDLGWDGGGRASDPNVAALLFGGSAWEELCFRVGGYGLCFAVARALSGALGAGERAAALLAEIAGLGGSTLLFAAAHLALFNAWLGAGGAEFDPALFTWLCLAGILLALVFRLRGPGVAAWSHGLFNLALWVGVDPDILL
jgi:hypothetical protein